MKTRAPIRTSALLAVALLVSGAAGADTMYRCKTPDGSLALQQTPCSTKDAGERIKQRHVPTTEVGENIRARMQRNASGEMTEADLFARYGLPAIVNTDVVDGQVSRQYVYRFPTGTQYFYSRGGVIYASQDRPGEARREPQPCHSAREIRSAEVDASSIRLTTDQRREALDRVEKMKGCRR